MPYTVVWDVHCTKGSVEPEIWPVVQLPSHMFVQRGCLFTILTKARLRTALAVARMWVAGEESWF